jgi:hypothetical protein
MPVPVPGSFRTVQMAMPYKAVPCPSVPARTVTMAQILRVRARIIGFLRFNLQVLRVCARDGAKVAGDRAKQRQALIVGVRGLNLFAIVYGPRSSY